jgi:hypothetical protein
MRQFESDAKACFDSEVTRFVFTCFHSHGAPMGPLVMWEQVLYNIIHKVKTGFGISTSGYSFTTESPIHGPGQGSKGGPSSCSTVTSILIDSMTRLFHGLKFSDPSQQTWYATATNMFIDDASNCANSFVNWLHTPPARNNIAEMLRHDAHTWERLLWTSGGLLSLLKCAYYILAWQFDAEGRPSLMPKDDLPAIFLSSGDMPGTEPVQHLNFEETHRYLGNFLSNGMQ